MKIDLCFNPRRISLQEVEENLPPIIEVFKLHDVSFAYLFGSILTEESPPQDIDIALYIENPIKCLTDYYTDIYFDICDIFHADNIDVVMLNNTGPVFRYTVISTGRLIYFNNQNVVDKFIEDTLFNYEDIKGLKKESRDVLFKAVREGLLMYKKKINLERIELFLKNMRNSVQRLITLRQRFHNFEEFMKEESTDNRELCVHYLRLALESVLDISRHIIAVKGFSIPDMEKENLLDVLGKERVLPHDFAKKIRGMQGVRNAIVHVYWNLDYEKIYKVITENLGDFEQFAKYILEFVEKEDN